MKSKPIVIIGIVLILLGLYLLIFHDKIFTTHEEVLELGPIQTSIEHKKTIPPIWGGLVLAGGVILLVWGFKR